MWVDNDKKGRKEIGRESVDFIRLVSARNKWRTLVSTFSTLLIPHITGYFLISCSPLLLRHSVEWSCGFDIIGY
jgi:hypothetical protein